MSAAEQGAGGEQAAAPRTAPGADRWGRGVDELPIVLTGGPADGQGYWRDDFIERQTAARRMAEVHHRTPLDPASWPLLYEATTSVATHHRDPNRRAVQWRWTGPAEIRTLHDLAALHGSQEHQVLARRHGHDPKGEDQ